MKILSIETSCDDTAITMFEVKGGAGSPSFKILANVSNSQIQIHIPYGGVFPALAKREHIKNLPILFESCLKKAKLDKKKIPVDLIAVTYGPGLEPSLWTGIVYAKELAEKWKIPLIPVNHMEGHILSVFGKDKGKFEIKKGKLPMLSLLVSGGHTELVLSTKWMDYQIIGETLDDAVGEAFDKVARMLGLPYPGGPEISKLADGERRKIVFELRETENKASRGHNFSAEKFVQSSGRRPVESPQDLYSISLPRPMLYTKDFNFSFSGLKTAVLYLLRKISPDGKLDNETKSKIALEFENAAIECLVHKTQKALKTYKIKTLVVAGGVAANQHLRTEMQKITDKKIKLLFPKKGLSGDNSMMIGIAGYLNYIKNKKKVPKLESIKAAGNLRL